MEPGGEAGEIDEIDGDVGEMVVDVIGGEVDRISDDVGEMLVDQRDFLLICPQCHSSEVSSSLSKKVLQRGDPWEKFHLDQIPTERALRHR